MSETPTPRELECLRLVVELGTAETAAVLRITTWTVRSHVRSAREKLDGRSIAHAYAVAVRRGLIDPHETTVA